MADADATHATTKTAWTTAISFESVGTWPNPSARPSQILSNSNAAKQTTLFSMAS